MKNIEVVTKITNVEDKINQLDSQLEHIEIVFNGNNETELQAFFDNMESGKRYLINNDIEVSKEITISNINDFTLTFRGYIIPRTDRSSTNKGFWEVENGILNGVLKVNNCFNFKIIPKIKQTNKDLFGKGNALLLTNCKDFTISNGHIELGIDLQYPLACGNIRIGTNCQNGVISDNKLIGNYIGVYGGSGVYHDDFITIDNIVCRNNYIEGLIDISLVGILFDGDTNREVSNISYEKNYVKNFIYTLNSDNLSYYEGLALASVNTGFINDNIIVNCGEGVHVEHSDNVIIKNNIIKNINFAGISVLGKQTKYINNNIIESNVIENSIEGNNAINIAYTSNTSVSNNKVNHIVKTSLGYSILYNKSLDFKDNSLIGLCDRAVYLLEDTNSNFTSVIGNNCIDSVSTLTDFYIRFETSKSIFKDNKFNSNKIDMTSIVNVGTVQSNISAIGHKANGKVKLMGYTLKKNSFIDRQTCNIKIMGRCYSSTVTMTLEVGGNVLLTVPAITTSGTPKFYTMDINIFKDYGDYLTGFATIIVDNVIIGSYRINCVFDNEIDNTISLYSNGVSDGVNNINIQEFMSIQLQ